MEKDDITTNLCVRISIKTNIALQEYAKEKKVTGSEVIRQLLGKHLKIDPGLKRIVNIVDDD